MKRYWPSDYGLSKRILKRFLRYKFEAIIFVTFTAIVLALAYFASLWDVTPTFLATFAGVFLSFLLLNSLEKRKARKAAVHALVAIWLELRHNREITKDIKKNFNFPEVDIATLPPITGKISSLRIWASRLEDKSFYAAQQSRAFFEIKNDKTYNAVQTAYYNLKSMQTILLASELSLVHFNSVVLSVQGKQNKLPKEYIKKSVKEHISKCETEINISLRITREAVDELADTLKKYGVTVAEELRDTKLANKYENQKSTKI